MGWFKFFKKKKDEATDHVSEEIVSSDTSEWPKITQLQDDIEYLQFKNYGRFRVKGSRSQFRTIDVALKSKGA